MTKHYDLPAHDQLDAQLIELLKIVHAGAGHDEVAGLAMKIVAGCASEGWLIRPNWEDCWRDNGYLASGWFSDLPLDEATTDALFDVFESMVRLVLDTRTSQRRTKHQTVLRESRIDYLELRGQDATAITEVPANDVAAARLAEPTKAYCLIPPNTVRWEGEVEVEQRFWHMLGFVLDHRQTHGSSPIPCEDIEQVIRSKSRLRTRSERRKYVANAASDLSKKLVDIGFPWTLSTKGEYLVYDECACCKFPAQA